MNIITDELKLLISITLTALENNEAKLRTLCNEYLQSYSFQSVYEALLQLHLFAGYPCSLTALSILQSEFQQINPKSSIIDSIDNEPYNYQKYKDRGLKTCELVYTNTYAPLMAKLKEYSPQLQEWMLIDGYGKTLSRSGLSIQQREILLVSVLLVQGWKKQLYSHLRGAKNVGCSQNVLLELLSFGNEFFSPSNRQYAQEVISSLYE
jgi:4-carboxymuconolactone decarboxylase